MTSFAVEAEPAATPRLAAAALAVHLAGAAAPWLARVPAPLAALASVVSLAGLAGSLAALPGRHASLAALALDGNGCRVRLRGERGWRPARIGARSRAHAGMALIDVSCDGRRYAWLLSRASLPGTPFRRLKARIRLSC
jgi:hypothetical protein